MTRYARTSVATPPFWKRCKVRHSRSMPARCKRLRGHDGDCRFGWWPPYPVGRGTRVNLDCPPVVIDGPPRVGAPTDFDD